MRFITRFFSCYCCGSEPETDKVDKRSTELGSIAGTATATAVPVKRKKDVIPKKVRDAVWVKYHGEAEAGTCYCCGKDIQRYNAGWHCSHVLSDLKGGAEIVENLRTCCPHCNLSMGSQNLYVYMKEHNMPGPGKENVEKYLATHKDQINDKRTTGAATATAGKPTAKPSSAGKPKILKVFKMKNTKK